MAGPDPSELLRVLANAPPLSPPLPFHGSARWQVVRRIGAGGFGQVFEARDRATGVVVALKLLRKGEPENLLAFKREFRAAAHLVHPNLVRLHELCVESGRWFFTMELVKGRPLLEVGRWSSQQLRDKMAQLASGLVALHDAGFVHCDVKPSNVMVDVKGRTVLLDFGLVTPIESPPGGALGGTAGYMSPEQRTGSRVERASDWYSFGAILREGLLGRAVEISTRARRRSDPQRSAQRQDPCREGLLELSQQLLAADPAARPDGAEVLRRLDARPPPRSEARREVFVGREPELGALLAAIEGTGTARPSMAIVVGEAGIGKTALLAELGRRWRRAHPDGLLLEGRCFEREALPFRALDGVIDQLAHVLSSPAAGGADVARPPVRLAVELFPVLGRAATASASPPAAEPAARRREAVAELRTLLRSVAAQRPMLISLDDLQWADLDSAALLADILAGPAPPALAIVGAERGSGGAAGPFVAALDSAARLAGARAAVVRLQGLTADDARLLVQRLTRSAKTPTATGEELWRATGGNPFLLREAAGQPAAGHVSAAGVAEAIAARAARVGPAARRVLDLVVIAAAPLSQEVVAEASARRDVSAELRCLEAERLCSSVAGRHGACRFAPYHERIRECIVGPISPEALARYHRALARALETEAAVAPGVIATHWEGAGATDRAAVYAARAGDAAGAALAFDLAASWYRKALHLGRLAGEPRRDLRQRLGRALASAGRFADSADVLLAAGADAPAEQRLALYREAAEHLATAGQFDRAQATLASVSAAAGAREPQTRIGRVLSWAASRAWLRVRGFDHHPRRSNEVPADELLRVDALEIMARSYQTVDQLRGMQCQTRYLLAALRAGEPRRVARALAIEALYCSHAGTRGFARAGALVEASLELAGAQDDPRTRALADIAHGHRFGAVGEWARAAAHLQRAESTLVEHCTGVTWELALSRGSWASALSVVGQLRALSAKIDGWITDADARRDRYAHVSLRISRTPLLLRDDRPGDARDELHESAASWGTHGFTQPTWRAGRELALVDIYRADYEAAYLRMKRLRWRLRTSGLVLAQSNRISSAWMLAVAALGTAARADAPVRRRVAEAERLGEWLVRAGTAWARLQGQLVLAGVAELRGQRSSCRRFLLGALDGADRATAPLALAATKLALASLPDQAARDDLRAHGLALLSREGVREPRHMLRTLVPWVRLEP